MDSAWGGPTPVPTHTEVRSAIHGKSPTYFHHLGAHALDRRFIAQGIEHIGDPIRQLPDFGLLEAAGRHGGGAYAQSAADGGRPRIVGHRILVDGDVRPAERRVRILAR